LEVLDKDFVDHANSQNSNDAKCGDTNITSNTTGVGKIEEEDMVTDNTTTVSNAGNSFHDKYLEVLESAPNELAKKKKNYL
jgi:hypothetical protein